MSARPGVGPRSLGVLLALTAIIAINLGAFDGTGNELGEEESDREHPDVTRVELNLEAPGDVVIGAGATDNVQVRQTVRGSFRDPATDQQSNNGTLSLSSDCGLGIFDWLECSVDYTITVPPSIELSGYLSSGDLTILDVDGEIDLTVSNGSIDLTGGTARVKLNGVNGSIAVVNNRSREIELRTTNGDLSLSADGSPALITARSTNGEIDIQLPTSSSAYSVQTDTVNGQVDVGIKSDQTATQTIRAGTVNGDVTIEYIR